MCGRLRRRTERGQEELPYVRGQGQKLGDPMPEGRWPRGVTPTSEVRGGGRKELPHASTPEARGGGWEEQPYVQGAVAARVQEGLEELSHIEGQEGW